MRSGIVIDLGSADRERLERTCKDRNTPQKHVWRAEIVLLSANGVGTSEIMRRTGTSKTCVWRWQERFMQEGGGRPARQDPPVAHPCSDPGGCRMGRGYSSIAFLEGMDRNEVKDGRSLRGSGRAGGSVPQGLNW